MEQLIQVVNRLQDTFAKLGVSAPLDLPQIVVVGGQSAGKSSVLENFVGRDFLPRGSGIVTRRPLVLQLINNPGHSVEYAEFLHQPNKRYTNFAEVCREIEVETDRVTGTNKNISPLPINLRIFSPHVLTLTLVDLPGLTKVPVGDQPADIDRQIRNMALQFVSNPNCLVLAVTPANIDLANSDALLLAREVDPQGLRTIGVITKIDLMDRGTDCRDVLLNITYPLKRGYVGVVNRSQADINARKDIKAAHSAEQSFFNSHPSYRDIASRTGTFHLQNVLHRQLSDHIKKTLPSLKKNLNDQLLKLDKEIGDFTDVDAGKEGGQARRLIALLQDFSFEINTSLGLRNETLDIENFSFGVKIKKLLFERFPLEMSKVNTNADKMRAEIRISIENSQGMRSTIFTPDAAFTVICKKKIAEYRDITIDTIDRVYEQLNQLIENSASAKINNFVALQDEVKTATSRQLFDLVNKAKEQVDLLINMEMSYINTRHPDFLRATTAQTSSKEVADESNNFADQPPITKVDTALVINSDSDIIIKKGHLSLLNNLIKTAKSYWFVLKGDYLNCYKDEREKQLRFTVSVEHCVLKSVKKNSFAIHHSKNTHLIKEVKQIELIADTEEAAEDWKAALYTRGVKLSVDEKNKSSSLSINENITESAATEKNHLNRQIELIRGFVNIYVKIVSKSLTDLISKLCMYMIVDKLNDFIQSELVVHLYDRSNIDDLLKQSDEQILRKKELIAVKNACLNAVNIMNDLINFTPTNSTNSTNSTNTQKALPPRPANNGISRKS